MGNAHVNEGDVNELLSSPKHSDVIATIENNTYVSDCIEFDRVKVKNLSFIERNTVVTSLHLYSTRTVDISHLKKNVTLAKVEIIDNLKIGSYSAFSMHPSITHLTLSYCNLTDISFLAGNRIITHLNLSNNSIRSIEILGDNDTVVYLDLSNNLIEDLSPLRHNTAISHLNVTFNNITSLEFIRGNLTMTRLNARSNSIADISPLRSNRTITSLDLFNNPIADMSSLWGNTHILCINLRGNLCNAHHVAYIERRMDMNVVNYANRHTTLRSLAFNLLKT